MGCIETRGRKRARKRDLQRALLGAVAVTGLLALAAVPTNLPIALRKLGMFPTGMRDSGVVNRARNRLLKKGLLTRTKEEFLRLTPEGERFFHACELRERVMRKPKRWDGRWRVLIFDIPQRRKGLRDQMRRMLRGLGFVRLQDSVWAYPYDCEDYVALLKADMKVGKDVLYLIVDEMEGDAPLRAHFELARA